MQKILCNICKGSFSEDLYKIRDYEGIEFNIVRCQRCELVYINPRFEPSEIRDFYGEDYFIFEDIKHVRQIKYAVEALKDINRFKKGGRLLDIGSAKGTFLFVARKCGFEVYGLEISKFAAEFTHKVFDIETKIGTLEVANYPENHFDVVTMFDVIEHVQDPLNTMLEVNKSLKENGIVILETPNVESLYSKFRGKAWPGYGKFHLYNFSYNTLIRLLKEAGFEIISQNSLKANIFSFDGLWRWGILTYRAYTRLEQIFILSKICSDIDAPIKKMYERGELDELLDVVEKQVSEVLFRRSAVNKLLKCVNYPFNRFLGKRFGGDALRIIAKITAG